MGFTTRLWVNISPFFRRFPAKHRYMAERVNRRIAVDRRHGYIYFRIPKAANSTVIRNFIELPAGNDFESGSAKESFARVSQLTWSEVRKLEERFFLFTVVRDPFTRAVSAYFDKVQRSPRRTKVVSGLRRTVEDHISFEEFCDFLESGGLDEDAHWCRQIDLVPCGYERLHAVGRVESLDVDLPGILDRAIGHRPEIASYRPHQTGAGSRLKEIYTPETVERIRTIYRADFETLGYPMEPGWTHELG